MTEKKAKIICLVLAILILIFAFIEEIYIRPEYLIKCIIKISTFGGVILLYSALTKKKIVDIINLKCDMMAGALRMQPGILPAYHMHRDSWVSILLDGTVPAEDILPLIDLSYQLTAPRPKRRKA